MRDDFDELWRVKRNLQFKYVETNFGKHDNTNFETTLTYKHIDSLKCSKQRFKVDFYFFVPKSLIAKDFSPEAFLSNLTNHLRLRTIDLAPSIFLDTTNPHSPLCKMLKIKTTLLDNPQADMTDKIVDATRSAASYILHQLKTLEKNDVFPPNYDFIKHYRTELKLSNHMMDAFRGIIYVYNQIFPKRLESTLANINLIDEYISYNLEKRWIKVLSLPQISKDKELVSEIKGMLKVEFRHRENFRFLVKKHPQELSNEREGELFTYHLGLVKKFVQDQLYLNVSYMKNNLYLRNSAAMVGAAIAALFAYSVEFINRGVYKQTWDYHAFTILMVSTVAYVLKDRIKEITKSMFHRRMSSYDLRRNIYLREQPEKPFAHTIESVRVVDPEHAPNDIKRIRNQTALAHIVQYRHEKTLHYSKKIEIDWDNLNQKQEVHRDDLKEIYRFNFSDICRQMDNTNKLLHFFDPDSENVVDIELPKVYHINLVLSLVPYAHGKNLDETKHTYLRTRLVLDKNGIKRVEDVAIMGSSEI